MELTFHQQINQNLIPNENWSNQELISRAFNEFWATRELECDEFSLDSLISNLQQVFNPPYLQLTGISYAKTETALHYTFHHQNPLTKQQVCYILTNFDNTFQLEDDYIILQHESDNDSQYFHLIIDDLTI